MSAHTLLIRIPTIRDWRCDGKCSCEGWEFFDAYDLFALERAFRDFHLRRVTLGVGDET